MTLCILNVKVRNRSLEYPYRATDFDYYSMKSVIDFTYSINY